MNRKFLAAVLILIVFGWAFNVYSLDTQNLRQLTRGQLWTGFRNEGTQGGVWDDRSSRGAPRLTYPGMGNGLMLNMAGADYIEYFGKKNGFSWAEQKNEAQNLSGGEGIWVLTNVGGEYGVSYSGPWTPSADIAPMYYDIANSPEANWGYQVEVPPHGLGAGAIMPNWYPGAALQTDAPRTGVPYEVLNHRWGQYMDADKDDRAEDIVFSRWTTKHGVTITRKAMAWSYQGFDDFFILEVEFENTGDSDGDGVADVNGGAGHNLTGAYFSFVQGFTVSMSGEGNWNSIGSGMPGSYQPQDDQYRYTGASNYDGPAEYVDLKMNYQWDGDSIQRAEEDTGQPVYLESVHGNAKRLPGGVFDGQMRSPQYVGVAPLAYRDSGPSHVFNADDQGKYVNPVGEQPRTSKWWETRDFWGLRTDLPNLQSDSEQGIYETFSGTTDANPTTVNAMANALTFGPYNLAVGEKAKIVVAYVAGTGAQAISREGQSAYAVDVQTFCLKDIPLPVEERLARLSKGEAALVAHLKAAQFAYDNMYDLPDYPPDVKFAPGVNQDAEITLTWNDAAESSAHPDFGDADVVGYRVFRSAYQEFGPWEDVGTVTAGTSGSTWDYSGGQYVWRDNTAVAGFRYFYNVRAFAKPRSSWSNGMSSMGDLPEEVQGHLQAGLEGGYSAPEQRVNLDLSPFQPGLAPSWPEKRVRVVPNPFSLSEAAYNYQSSKKIRFLGLPPKSRVLIFNVAGDIVGEILHDDASSGEASWFQIERNVTSPDVASGIYFYVVESLTPESMGQTVTGTFYILR
ncbi:MAG: hypothetical protein F4Y39_23565 [Gemmatimonadetes bacterium]|nr:hypothetical protein [Gemmatimonadota bacterium]MYK53432.1 hypothetical protein [Gemmatimonadota bacterium]